jgi:hypothetical protein
MQEVWIGDDGNPTIRTKRNNRSFVEVYVEGAKVFGPTADSSLKNVYVLGIPDRGHGLVKIDNFGVCREKGYESDDVLFGQREAIAKPRIVENSLNLLKHRARKNQSMPTVEKLKQERSG